MFFLVAGYHFYFSLQLCQVKKEMKKSLSVNRSSLEVFHFNKTEYAKLQWDGDDEFNRNGTMYDVLEMHESNGIISISCIADKKETALIASQLHKREQTNNNSLVIIKLISIPFVVKDMNQSVTSINADKEQFCNPCKLFTSFHPAASPQPPENC